MDEPELEYLMMECKTHKTQKAMPIKGGVVCELCLKDLSVYRVAKKDADAIARYSGGL